MNILISFLPSVFPDYNHGGSTKILKEISSYLGKQGDSVTILCNRRADNYKIFNLTENVIVKPILRFRETVPDPYFTPPYNLSTSIKILYEESLKNDVIFNFDSNFLFNDIFPEEKVLISSLRDFLYSQALQGAFLLRRGPIVVNSEFVMESIISTVGRFFPDIKNHIKLIHNGVNADVFKRKHPKTIYKFIPKEELASPVILFPHRPEKDKGIFEALEVVSLLVNRFNLLQTKLLIATGIDEGITDEVDSFNNEIVGFARMLNIQENIVFHKWIPETLLAEYYSLGNVTLCIGDIPEAFSNTTIESLACGTPVIASNIASYKSLFSDNIVRKVDIHNANQIASLVAKKYLERNFEAGRNYVIKNFSNESMCMKYHEIIHNTLENSQLTFAPLDLHKVFYHLAPWCCIVNGSFYNEYSKKTYNSTILADLILQKRNGFTINDCLNRGISFKKVDILLDKGIIVPII